MDHDLSVQHKISILFELYSQNIFQYAYYVLGNRQDALDVVQNTYLKVIQSWHTFREDSQVKTWLWSIAKHCVIDVTRKQRRHHLRMAYETPLRQLREPTPNVTAIELSDLIRRLPIPQRQVVILRLLQEFTTRETAQTLGWTESKVRNVLHKAVKTLRIELNTSEYGGDKDVSNGHEGRSTNTF